MMRAYPLSPINLSGFVDAAYAVTIMRIRRLERRQVSLQTPIIGRAEYLYLTDI